jgi:hypothetical protein
MQMSIVGSDGYMEPVEPGNDFDNVEVAFRYAKRVSSFKLSGYAYRGFYKDPLGVRILDPATMAMELYYPRLNVYGASLRGQLAGGILWIEGGYYDSREDTDGTDYFVENSSIKALAGFERQVATDFTGNIQFQAEVMSSYNAYKKSREELITGGMLPETSPIKDEVRTLITSRWTKQLMMQTLTISLFGFYSPSDEDAYIRFSTEYKYTDELGLVFGGNIFEGTDPHTMFAQFDHNDNVYVRINYGF